MYVSKVAARIIFSALPVMICMSKSIYAQRRTQLLLKPEAHARVMQLCMINVYVLLRHIMQIAHDEWAEQHAVCTALITVGHV